MPETFSLYEDKLLKVDVKNDGIVDGTDEDRIKREARDYTLGQKKSLTEKDFRGLVDRIDTLLKQHDIELAGLGVELEQAKRAVRGETKEQTSTVRELQLSDIRSPAGLSHYIDRSGDETMKILEEQIGLESTWKILALTAAHTSIELGKGLADILKLGEGTAEGMTSLDRKDLNKKEKALELAKGIGLDGLRALGIVGGVGALGKVVARAKVSEIITDYKEPLGAHIWPKQRGAVGDLSREQEPLKWFKKAESPLGLPKLEEMMKLSPREFKDKIMQHEIEKIRNSKTNFEIEIEDLTINSRETQRQNLNENGNRWIHDILGNMNNLVRYLEEYNPVRLGFRKQQYGQELHVNGFNELDTRIVRAEQTKGFVLDEQNGIKLRELVVKIEAIALP